MPGGPVLHCAAVKMRVVGNGVMKSIMYGFNKIESDPLYPQDLSPTNRWEVTLLSNFQGERMKLRIYTENMDDFVKINNITFYIKPIWGSNPL